MAAHLLAQGTSVVNLKCEYQINPISVSSLSPHFSWELQSGRRGVMQSAYRILVADDSVLLQRNTANIWDSQKVKSDASIQIAYIGKPLTAAKKYYWKVMVWDNKKQASLWSKVAQWQMGLLTPADWKGAKWIAYEDMPDSMKIFPTIPTPGAKKRAPGTDILPILRKEFDIAKQIKSATAFISGLGHFEMNLNGKKVGDHFLDAGWVDYQKQALYVSFDITGQIKPGKNAVGVLLGNGFYFTPSGRYRKLTVAYGYPKMICRLLIQYTDGTSADLVSDTSWKATPGPITFSAIYGGEDYDATKEQTGWDQPSFNDKSWSNAIVVSGPKVLNAQNMEPVKIFNVFTPQKATQIKAGEWVYDLGQNASGIPQISVKGNRGDTVIITPSELLDQDSLVTQKNTGRSHYYRYILKGEGEETWQPRFTYYGFRYLQVNLSASKNSSGDLPKIVNIQGLHTRNSAARVGDFSCSSDLFNRTNTLIDWSIKSNMVSILTDCPHREKLGWLEEDHLMGNSLQYNYDIAALCKKIINDMKDAQTPDGLIPEIAPEFTVFDGGFRDSPEWGSNCVLLPWYVYQWYGDKQVLADSYPMMIRYMEYLAKQANNHILSQGLGDWYDIGPKHPGVSQLTPKGITATAFYYYDLCLLSDIARLLNKPADIKNYTQLAAVVKQAFNNQFFNKETKQYGSGSQTANAIAVYMKLVNPDDKAAVVENIVKDLRSRNNSLTAGDIGYRYLLKVLEDEGRSDVIFDMNNHADVPGYGYQLAKGATALTESWQALPSVSNNHFMLGHLMEWFYAGLAGIRPADDVVAYKKIVIRPEIVGDITSANGSYHSVYGSIKSEWVKKDKELDLTVEIPANTTALVYLPVQGASQIIRNGKRMPHVKIEIARALVNIGSGVYHFKVTE
ncbi:alpha-L-rhamnosidase [Mucilaginibacter paludis DSM 18603]|uniref:alpha-L-rhamnosidase n=2 Tax=Mucilaginibacter TaxID=423349 RepID=H1YER3_9SPHI|nr:alpha-L-rhamnosidase [Mucilaginibacter paludis DSM 18603]